MNRPSALLAALVAFTSANPAPAQECAARSGPVRAALVELYTSEGCSSCPPADRWLSSLGAAGYGAERVVPLAFHVDYWDYIGWKDEFASARHGERQRQMARTNRSALVYTPQVLLGGAEYRGWGDGRDLDARLKAINDRAPGADIGLAARRAAEGSLEVSATAALRGTAGDAALYLALRENRLASEVRAGENSGRRLDHDYVVRELIGPVPFAAGKAQARRVLALQPRWKRADLGIAAFVQDRTTGEVLQAVALGGCL
jgi:hypothetical protein